MRHHNHMIGLALLTPADTVDTADFSFRVNEAGWVSELGWGATSERDLDIVRNPPPGSNVHTVYVEAGGTGHEKNAIRDLISEHKTRYTECRMFVKGVSLEEWVRTGCLPVEIVEEVTEEGEEEDDVWTEISQPAEAERDADVSEEAGEEEEAEDELEPFFETEVLDQEDPEPWGFEVGGGRD